MKSASSARWAAPMLVCILISMVQTASAQDPRISVQIQPASGTWVGQPASLQILVEVPTWFTGGIDIPELEVKGVIIRRAPGRAVSSTTREGDVTWAGLTHSLLVYPLHEGEILIPTISVGVKYSVEGKSTGPITLETAPISLLATVPEAARGLGYFVAAETFELTEELDADPVALRQGDSLTRRITQTVPESLAMLLPPVTFEASDGLSVYSEAPQIEDRGGQRGQGRTAVRIDAATYVFEKPGSYSLPAVERSWWNIATAELRTERIEPVTVEVVVNPDLAQDHLGGWTPEEPTSQSIGSGPSSMIDWIRRVAVVLAIALLGFWALRITTSYLGRRRIRDKDPGQEALELFRKTARENRPKEAYGALVDWVLLSCDAPSLEQFLELVGSSELTFEVEELARFLFGSQEPQRAWQGAALLEIFDRNRNALVSRTHRKRGGIDLPALNPKNRKVA